MDATFFAPRLLLSRFQLTQGSPSATPTYARPMSTNSLARFDWAKLERAEAVFEDGKLDGAGEICLQLVNDFDCPRYVQVKRHR